ncbi:phage tail protein [Macrococcus armenti]|uniref:phage tail protein n=1 Tax=Macrococcus armenti TaxID=2875764 RepID=UPI001CD3844F|nr:phage tail protein [Macrococcus armenti]UBH10069.1 phage tail protein [Macrococcus armenti]
MIVITDLNNNSHALLANKTIKKELNGDHTIELEVHQQKNNELDLNSISEMWTVTYKNIDYKIVYIDKITKGNSFYLKLRGKPLFYDEFSTSVIHYFKKGSMTAVEAFTNIFAGTSFNFILQKNAFAASWEGFGKGATRLDLFKKALDKYEYEFYIEGSTVYLNPLIGNDTNFLYKYKLNASNIQKSIDATAMYTHIKGFGDMKEGEEDYLNNANLKREYTSGLASIIGIREAPPVLDGRIKHADTLDKKMKAIVDNSLQVNVSATLHDLRKQGYQYGIPTLGDRTFLLDERIDEKVEIRVYGLKETYDEQDVLKKCDVDFGSQAIRKRYASKLSNISKTMSNILNGRVKLPFEVLDIMAQDMIKKIQSVSTELILDNGIFAVDKNNPNNVVGLNSAGWYISTDGGKTAKVIATADGIVANAITSGTINTNLVRVIGNDADKYIAIENDQLTSYGTYQRTWQGVTGMYETFTRIKSGIIRIRNEKLNRSLYYTDFGISTYVDGDGDESSSGTLAFFDTTYSTARGVTLQSNFGVVALKSALNRVILDANLTVNIESETSSIYLRPMKDNRNGKNEFRFWVKDNNSASDTDGVLTYGALTGGDTTYGSGIRFDKSPDGSTVYATNNNGDKGSGNFQAKDFIKSSTREIKKNISNLTGGIDAIKSLTPVSYKYILDDSDDIGFIAEDSDCIAVADGKAVSVQKIATWAVLASKEQQEIIEKQGKLIDDLTKRLETLESK